MSLENSNKKPTPEMEESFLIDQKLQLTVEDDFSCFIKIEEIAGILDPYSIHQKKIQIICLNQTAKQIHN